jgi:hypothetical protein
LLTIKISPGDVASSTVGQAVYAACQWGMISVLARLGNPEIVGQYALGVAISGPILVLARTRRRADSTTNIRVLSLVLALLGIAAVGFLEHSLQDRLVVLLVAMGQSVEWVADLYAGRRRAVSLLLHGTLSVAALAAVIRMSGHIGAALLAVLIVRLLILFVYDFRRGPQDRRDAGGCETILPSFAGKVPCYFIVHMLGYRSLGIFAALAALTPAVDVLINAIARAAGPELAGAYRNGDSQSYARLSAQLASCGVLLGLCTVLVSALLGRQLLEGLFGSEYAAHASVLVALAAASGLGYVATLLGCARQFGRDVQASLPIELTAVFATAFASVAMIPRYGLAGAAFAVGLGCLSRIGCEMWLLRSLLRHVHKPVLLELLNEPL